MIIRDVSRKSVRVVVSFWEKLHIPTGLKQHCVDKLDKVFEEWIGLKKHSSMTSYSHKTKGKEFTESLDRLFDIAYADCGEIGQVPRGSGVPSAAAAAEKTSRFNGRFGQDPSAPSRSLYSTSGERRETKTAVSS